MPVYKHYSFDLWLTLIKSNPSFKIKRTRFFYDNFNYAGKTLEEVGVIFRQVDIMCNTINEKTGKNIDAEEMYLMVIMSMNNYSYPAIDINLDSLLNEMEDLLFKNVPFVYSSETQQVLRRIKESGDNTLSILSNTGFIKGKLLRKVLKQLEMDHFFDFQLYSDEEGMSKPNRNLFQLMLDRISVLNKEIKIDLKDIIHIGDNPKADIEGANSVGISSLLINSNSVPILHLIS